MHLFPLLTLIPFISPNLPFLISPQEYLLHGRKLWWLPNLDRTRIHTNITCVPKKIAKSRLCTRTADDGSVHVTDRTKYGHGRNGPPAYNWDVGKLPKESRAQETKMNFDPSALLRNCMGMGMGCREYYYPWLPNIGEKKSSSSEDHFHWLQPSSE